MTISYKDAPMSLKEIGFRLNRYASLVRALDSQNIENNEEYKVIKSEVDASVNNEVNLLLNNSLFVKQVVKHGYFNVITIESTDYTVEEDYCSQIVVGDDRVLILTLLSSESTYYIGVCEGLFYGEKMLKWGDFDLLKIGSSAFVVNSGDELIESVKKHTFYALFFNDKFYVCTSGSGSLKLLVFDPLSNEWNDISPNSTVAGYFNRMELLNITESNNLNVTEVVITLICNGILDNELCSCVLTITYETTTTSDEITTTVSSSVVNITGIKGEFHSLASTKFTSDTYILIAIGESCKAYLHIKLDDTDTYKWEELSLPDFDEDYFEQYVWSDVCFDPVHAEFMISYSSPKQKENAEKEKLVIGNPKMITLNVIPSIDKLDDSVLFKTSYTISEDKEYINTAAMIFNQNRFKVIAAFCTDGTSGRINNCWSDKGCHATINNSSVATSISCPPSTTDKRIYLLTKAVAPDLAFYVYILAYDINTEWANGINNYFTYPHT